MPSKKQKPRRINWTFVLIFLLAFIILVLYGHWVLKSNSPVQPSPPAKIVKSENLTGIYKGQLPCADCSGIEETLMIAGTDPESGTYVLEDLYKEKSTKPFTTQGKWQLNNKVITLNPTDNSDPGYLQLLDNGNLEMLDLNMQKIESPFNKVLTRQN